MFQVKSRYQSEVKKIQIELQEKNRELDQMKENQDKIYEKLENIKEQTLTQNVSFMENLNDFVVRRWSLHS